MKVAVLCLCLISITAAWPVRKSKQYATSTSSEEKYDSRGHHLHRYHHGHVNSQSWESQQTDLASPQQTLYSSEESVDVPVEPHFPDVSSKSHEDVDDNDDDNDSNDTDESDEVVTGFPTDIPVTVPFPPFPFTRGDNAGRGDSVAYRMRAKAALVKSIKLHKAAKKLMYDATEEDESDLAGDSHRAGLSREDPAAGRSVGKHSISAEWGARSGGQDSREPDSSQPEQSLENDSRQQLDSQEADGGDGSKAGGRGDSLPSAESRESQPSDEGSDGTSHQKPESAEDSRDRHSIENNEVTL